MIERHSKVFVPVSVSKRLPDKSGIYMFQLKQGSGFYRPHSFDVDYPDLLKNLGDNWLEEKENVYVLTEEELKEIRDALSYGEMEIKKLYKSSGYLNSNLLRFIGNALGKLQSKTNPQT